MSTTTHFTDEDSEAQREAAGLGQCQSPGWEEAWDFLWGMGLVGLPRGHPWLSAILLPIRKAQTLGQAGNVSGWVGWGWGEARPASRPCVSVLLFARRGVNEVMGLLQHSIRLGLTAVLRALGCPV